MEMEEVQLFLDEKIEEGIDLFIESNNIFSTLDQEQKYLFKESVNLVKFNKGETIFKQNAYTNSIAINMSGLIKYYVEAGYKRNLIFAINTPGDVIGLDNMYGSNCCDFTAQALTDVEIYQIRIDEFKQLISGNCTFCKALFKWYCDNMKSTFKKASAIATRQLNGKLAKVLLELSALKYLKEDIFDHLTRKDMAELINTNTETIIRILSKLKNDGYIDSNGKSIVIKDIKMIEKLAMLG